MSVQSEDMSRHATLLIVVFALLAHGIGLWNGFTNWDDPQLLLENEQVHAFDLVDIFTPRAGQTYQPVRVLSYAIDFAIFGERPFFYHAGNVVLHIIASVLLFCVFRRLCSVEVALCAALLFAVHPVNVEAVAWVASRKYGLVAVFAFLALLLHLRSSQSRKSQVGTGVASLAAMLSSPFGVMLPPVMVLVDYGMRRAWDWRRYLPVGIAALLAVGPIAMGLLAEGGISVDIESDKRHYTIFTMFRVIPQYLGMLLAPITLNCRYPLNVATSIGDWRVILGLVILVGFAIFAIRAARRDQRWPLVCGGWFVLWWLPVSNIVPTNTSLADRYLYLAAPGLFLALALALERLRQKQKVKIGVAVALTVLGLLAMQRTRVWHDPVSLWTDCLGKTPNNAVALHNLGTYYVTRGDFKAGHKHLTALAATGENRARLWSNLGVCEMNFGNPAKAREHFQSAVELEPDNPGYSLNLAFAALGTGDADSAAVALTRIQETVDQESYFDLIKSMVIQHRRCDLAGPLLQHFRTRWPGDFRGAKMLGVCLAELGQLGLAMQALNEAARLNPNDPATQALIKKVQGAMHVPR